MKYIIELEIYYNGGYAKYEIDCFDMDNLIYKECHDFMIKYILEKDIINHQSRQFEKKNYTQIDVTANGKLFIHCDKYGYNGCLWSSQSSMKPRKS
jgi:hypothetical protein